jgi:hypothetical protein
VGAKSSTSHTSFLDITLYRKALQCIGANADMECGSTAEGLELRRSSPLPIELAQFALFFKSSGHVRDEAVYVAAARATAACRVSDLCQIRLTIAAHPGQTAEADTTYSRHPDKR